MAILLTGGAGFIGSHLAEKLLAQGSEVVCLDDFNDYYDPARKRANIAAALENPSYHLVEGDIRDQALVERVFTRFPIEKVAHLAARAGVRPSFRDPLLYADVNVAGTLALLEAARRHRVGQFVFGSSSSVYGVSPRIPFAEDDPCDAPISPYAATKRAGELLGYTYHQAYGLPITSLRFFTVYGPRQRPDMAIHLFTRLIDQGQEVTLFGDGSTRRDYTYIDDIVAGVVAALGRPLPAVLSLPKGNVLSLSKGFEIINLGGAQTTSLLELVRLIEAALGKKAQIRWQPEQPGDVPLTYADVSKAGRLLGYAPKVPVPEGIGRFVGWYREAGQLSNAERGKP